MQGYLAGYFAGNGRDLETDMDFLRIDPPDFAAKKFLEKIKNTHAALV
jgi:hypothetical protein